MSFDTLGLRAELTEAVAAKGYQTPSPIQAKAIPAILEGRDVLGGSQTGTGKTAAFSLPLLQNLAKSSFKTKRPRALILTPTRELAAQVHQSVLDYGKLLELRSAVVFGGVGFQPQINAFRRGLDIVVATPGRLLDLCQQGEANLSAVEILVLDEADRMLDMGFIHDIRKILALLPAQRQNLFFSATFANEVKKLADSILRNPVEVEVAPRNATADRVDQEAYEVGQKSKRALLSKLILDGNWSQVLVFTRTKHGANRLAQQLEKDGIAAMAIHGNKSQGARERALAKFKSCDIQVLVATDIAARGLDIADLPYVVNYELPNVPEDYVHRIGRTGRAGKSGKAISLVSETEHAFLWDIEKLLKKQIPLYTMNERGESSLVERSDARPPKAPMSQKSGHAERGRQQGRSRGEPRSSKEGQDRPKRGGRGPRPPKKGGDRSFRSPEGESSKGGEARSAKAQPRAEAPLPPKPRGMRIVEKVASFLGGSQRKRNR